jgi:predicted nucleotidyltransferase
MEPSTVPERRQLERAVRTVTSAAPSGTFLLVVLFGSAARGEGGARDLDVGVLCAGTPDLVALTNSFTRALGYQAVDLVDLGRVDPLLAMHVARDGIALHEEPPGSFARFASLAMRRYADTRKLRDMEQREVEDFLQRSGVRP